MFIIKILVVYNIFARKTKEEKEFVLGNIHNPFWLFLTQVGSPQIFFSKNIIKRFFKEQGKIVNYRPHEPQCQWWVAEIGPRMKSPYWYSLSWWFFKYWKFREIDFTRCFFHPLLLNLDSFFPWNQILVFFFRWWILWLWW